METSSLREDDCSVSVTDQADKAAECSSWSPAARGDLQPVEICSPWKLQSMETCRERAARELAAP